jgi:hypothetical protein
LWSGWMSSFAISCIVFGCVLAGTIVGMLLRPRLPEKHVSQPSQELVKLGMGLVGTMTALVLGLLIASAKGSYDTQRNGMAQLAGNVIVWLTLILASFGFLAPPNPTAFITLLLCGLTVSSAVFLIPELDRPFEGVLHVSSGPMRAALAQPGK